VTGATRGDRPGADATAETADTALGTAEPASALAGVRWGRIQRHGDLRGSFRELWRASAFGGLGIVDAGRPDARFVQANLSTSAAGVLRGLHFHRRQLDHWVVARGQAWVALVDVRAMVAGAADRPTVETRELAEDGTVTIPAGVAHGFLALEPLELAYFVTNEYDGTDELGFAWDDPAAAVPWPPVPGTADGRPILSDRDLANPPLRTLVDRLRASG
jgi:dTDP-4-dehydrorhamnose 3,5-epimerase